MNPVLTLIVPVYNGEDFLAATLANLIKWRNGRSEIEIIIVNDGSTDATESIIKEAQKQSDLRSILLAHNKGKGAALRAGLASAKGSVVAFTDADLPYGLESIDAMCERIRTAPALQLLYGSRSHHKSVVRKDYGILRKFGRLFFSLAVRILAIPGVPDTQCGIKMLRRELVNAAVKLARLDRFAFDIELFTIARQNGMIMEPFPVELNHRRESSVRVVVDTLKMLFDILRIRLRSIRGFYRP